FHETKRAGRGRPRPAQFRKLTRSDSNGGRCRGMPLPLSGRRALKVSHRVLTRPRELLPAARAQPRDANAPHLDDEPPVEVRPLEADELPREDVCREPLAVLDLLEDDHSPDLPRAVDNPVAARPGAVPCEGQAAAIGEQHDARLARP